MNADRPQPSNHELDKRLSLIEQRLMTSSAEVSERLVNLANKITALSQSMQELSLLRQRDLAYALRWLVGILGGLILAGILGLLRWAAKASV